MLKLIVGGLWAAVVTAGSAFGVATMMSAEETMAEGAAAGGLDHIKTRVINVPILRDGEMTGYLLTRFVFTVGTETLAAMDVPPDIYVIDQIFRSLYTDPSIDFAALEPMDVEALVADIRDRVNARLPTPAVEEILIDRFDYISADEFRNQAARAVPG